MSITISDNSSYLEIGTKSINKSRILFFDRDEEKVFIVMSDRKEGHMKDQNTVEIPYEEVDDPQTFESAESLQTYLVSLCQI